jgi:hypothetical protein
MSASESKEVPIPGDPAAVGHPSHNLVLRSCMSLCVSVGDSVVFRVTGGAVVLSTDLIVLFKAVGGEDVCGRGG